MERIISGVIAIPLVLGITLYGHPWLFFILIASLVLVAAYEYFSMITNAGLSGFAVVGMILSFLLLVAYFFAPQNLPVFIFCIPLTLFTVWFFKGKKSAWALILFSLTDRLLS